MYVQAMGHTSHNLLAKALSTPDHALQLMCVEKYFFVVPGKANHIPECAQHLNTIVVVMFGAGVVLETTPRKQHSTRSNNSPSQTTRTILCEGCPSIVHFQEPHDIMLRNNNNTDERNHVVGLWLAFEEHHCSGVKRNLDRITLPSSDTQTETLSMGEDDNETPTQLPTQVSQNLLEKPK